MAIRKKVEKVVEFQAVKWIAQFMYFAGLTALIPLIPRLTSLQLMAEAKNVFFFAVGLIVAGFLLVYIFSGKRNVSYRVLGLTTLIPGLLAVLFSYLGPRRQTALLESFGVASDFVQKWVEVTVPNAWLMAGIYIILGTVLVWLSYKVRK